MGRNFKKKEKKVESNEMKKNLNRVMTYMEENNLLWFDVLPVLTSRESELVLKKQLDTFVTQQQPNFIVDMKKKAEQLLQNEVERFAQKNLTKNHNDEKYLTTMIKSGTLVDRVSAITLTIQSSPMHNINKFVQLLGMAKKNGRRESELALDSLKDLMLNNFLPDDRRLKYFHQNLIYLPRDSPLENEHEYLAFWYFEDCVKRAYAQLIGALESGLQDGVVNYKRACLFACKSLLAGKPEQEGALLGLLVNKLGDPDRQIASKVMNLLQEVLKIHPVMKQVVAIEVERLLSRKSIPERAKYNAVLFLNQLYLKKDTVEDQQFAAHLIRVYFSLFAKTVSTIDSVPAKKTSDKQKKNRRRNDKSKGQKKESSGGIDKISPGMERKLLSALLAGVNRAFPYANCSAEDFQEDINSMFRVVHITPFSTSVQALMLIFQVMNSTNSVNDRFYSALYEKLHDPKIRDVSRHTMFLNLVYRALKSDASTTRIITLMKRLLQTSFVMHPAFICAALFLISEVFHVKPILRSSVQRPAVDPQNNLKSTQSLSSGECVEGQTSGSRVLEETLEATDSTTEKSKIVADISYDPWKRNPLYSGSDKTFMWELSLFSDHYHPSVQKFCKTILAGERVEYSGDPLVDFTLSSFLTRFLFKKPKEKNIHRHKSSGSQPTKSPVNMEEFWHLDEADVDESDRFFHKFFNEREKRELMQGKTRKKKSAEDHEEEEEAFAQELAEGLMKDGNYDDEDPDMDDWSDIGSEKEADFEDSNDGQEFTASDLDCSNSDDDYNKLADDISDDQGDDASDDQDEGGFTFTEEAEELENPQKSSKKSLGNKRKNIFANAEDYESIISGETSISETNRVHNVEKSTGKKNRKSSGNKKHRKN